MARSDSPQAHPGGWPAQRPQTDYDLTQWTQGLGGAPLPNPKPQTAAPQQHHAAPQQPHPQAQAYGAHPAAPAPGTAYGQPPYSEPDQGYYWGADPQTGAPLDPYAAARHPAAPSPATQGYAQGPVPGHAAGAPGAAPRPAYGYAQPSGYAPSYQPEPQAPALRGAQYDQWAAPAPSADPRSYDLASYMPPQGRPASPAPAPDYGQLTADLGSHEAQGYSDWGHQAGGYAAQHGYGTAQPGYDASGYDANGYEAQAYADPAQAQGGYEDELAYDYEEPPRRRKGLMIAAALVGAIVVGGGVTFAYQNLLGPGTGGPTPVVKSAEGPSKFKPSDPGGKQFAHSDSKLLGRLGDGGASSEAEASGARKVTTLVVGRDGAIQAPSAPAVSVPVPGMTLIDVPGAEAAPEPAPAPPAKTAAAPIVVEPPPAPAAAPVVPKPVVPKTVNAEADPAPQPVAEKPKPKPVVKTAALPETAPAAAAAAPKAASGLGYVAVLASVPASGSSRIDALQQFADLQQRYGGILQNKTPDVQEANLGEKGRYHRLVVGPPGSKEGANSVCSQLKSAGYAGCWVMAY